MKNVFDKFLKRERLNCGTMKNIMDCPDYWEKLAVVS